MCVFAGSLPRDVDVDIYARLIRELKRLGVDCVVDTDGDPLRRAVRAEPDVISPNVLEAEELVGHEFNDDEDHVHRRARDGRARRARGDHDHARRLLRADGARGAGRPRARSTACAMAAGSVEPRATVGSGDAFLAGFVASPLPRPLASSTAWPTASPAAPSRPSTSARASSTPSRSGACWSEIEVERPDAAGRSG